MIRLRLLAPAVLTVAFALAACGGGGSGGTTSTAPSGSTAGAAASGGGGGGSASDQKFCDTFSNAKNSFSTTDGLPTGDDIKKIKKFADDLQNAAPSSIKADAKVLADYFRFIADAASKATGGGGLGTEPSSLPAEIAKITPAITNISVWASTHCSNGLGSSSAPSTDSSSGSVAPSSSALPSELPSSVTSALQSILQSAVPSSS